MGFMQYTKRFAMEGSSWGMATVSANYRSCSPRKPTSSNTELVKPTFSPYSSICRRDFDYN